MITVKSQVCVLAIVFLIYIKNKYKPIKVRIG